MSNPLPSDSVSEHRLPHKITAEALGTGFLVAAVVGSGIMAAKLAGGNQALALLCNTIPTGGILVVLIIVFGGISGAHFNPAVTAAFWIRKELTGKEAVSFVAAQIAGGILGTLAAHLMFDETLFQLSLKTRSGPTQWFSEFVAAFGPSRQTVLFSFQASPDVGQFCAKRMFASHTLKGRSGSEH